MTEKEIFQDYMSLREFRIDNSVGDCEHGTYFVFRSLGLSPGAVIWVGEDENGNEAYDLLGV